MTLSSDQQAAWETDGFFIVRGFAPTTTLESMTQRVIEIARASAQGQSVGDALPQPETALNFPNDRPEEGLSKLFRIHRQEPVFRNWACDTRLLEYLVPLIGPEIDCFLSQFIFKMPGAIGQPWHQDGHYFPFDRTPQVGVWLAVTEARFDNGPLWVLPGSHRETIHPTVPDPRPEANFGYVEIVDHDMSGAVPVLLEPGDALFFHSHLMHKSTDNTARDRRAAMVYHYSDAATQDLSQEKWGFTPPNIDWMPVRRRIDTQIEIAAPIAKVGQRLFDGQTYPDWNPYIVQIDGSIEAGQDLVALGVGADGSQLSMDVHVLESGTHHMRWEGGAPDRNLFKGDHHFVLERLSSNKTRLHHYEEFTGSLIADLWPSQAPTIRENFERMNQGLQQACEST